MPSDEAQREAEHRAFGRALCHLYASITGQSVPDALRRRLGDADALLVLSGAGIATGPIAARWAGAAPARPVQSRQQASIFDSDLRHAPAIFNAQLNNGDVREALVQVSADPANPVLAQKAARALSYIAQGETASDAMDKADSDVLLAAYVRQGGAVPPLGVSADASGRPRQQSAVHASVPALASEE
jgi:hypothetical protein